MSEDFIKGEENLGSDFIRGEGVEASKSDSEDYTENIKRITKEGGLKEPPANPIWLTKSLDSDNPFEILYLDYMQVNIINPAMVKGNYDILSTAWQKNLMGLGSASRSNYEKIYGENRTNSAAKRLQGAYNKLKSQEGISLYFDDVNNRRIREGIAKIQGLVDVALADGELTPNKTDKLIKAGEANGLSNAEVRHFLLDILKTQEFEIRSKPPKEDLLKNIWRQKGKQDPVLDTVNWLGNAVSSLEELGRVSFEKKEMAYTRFRNVTFLPQAVMAITRDDTKAEEFEKIIESVRDEEMRFLKIIYTLNGQLPFRFKGKAFSDIRALLDEACKDARSFREAEELFKKGYLQTWIECRASFEANDDLASYTSQEEIAVPRFSDTNDEGLILISWLKKEGEFVGEDDVLVELENEEAVFEICSGISGRLSQKATVGQQLKTGNVIATIEIFTDDIAAKKIKESFGFHSFLYQINKNYPYYLNETRVDTPEHLSDILKKSVSLWQAVTRDIQNRNITTWFATIGRDELIEKYNQLYEPVIETDWYNDTDRSMAAAQSMIQALSIDLPAPKVEFDQPTIQLLSIEGAGSLSHKFVLALQTTGYVSARLKMNQSIEGVSLSAEKINYNSYNQQTHAEIQLNIDPFKFVKDKTYQFTIVATTPYEQIELPVQLRTVFPTANFIKKLAIYGLLSAVYWSLGHIILTTVVTGGDSSFGNGFLFWLLTFALIYGAVKIMTVASKYESVAKTSNWIIYPLLLITYLFGPSFHDHTGDWFLFWVFPGAAVGTSIASKKYRLNRWLPLLAAVIMLILAYGMRQLFMYTLY